jgi:hypothetical protein
LPVPVCLPVLACLPACLHDTFEPFPKRTIEIDTNRYLSLYSYPTLCSFLRFACLGVLLDGSEEGNESVGGGVS